MLTWPGGWTSSHDHLPSWKICIHSNGYFLFLCYLNGFQFDVILDLLKSWSESHSLCPSFKVLFLCLFQDFQYLKSCSIVFVSFCFVYFLCDLQTKLFLLLSSWIFTVFLPSVLELSGLGCLGSFVFNYFYFIWFLFNLSFLCCHFNFTC